jgi:periplasmic divalent cation tolerance protein
MTGEIVILCTCSSPEEAEKLARLLVEERLAACVNAIPRVRSTYRWQGAVETAEEVLLAIKTAGRLFPEVEEKLRAAHSYEVPEVLALPVVDGSAPYLEWLRGSLKPGAR